MRLTSKIFHDLAIWMVAFGVGIGVAFPFFVLLFGVPPEVVLRPAFFFACTAAGILVAVFNYALARWTVGGRLRILADGMHHVERNLHEMTFSRDLSRCSPETCSLRVDSDDEIGASAAAFNRLVEALANSMRTQEAVRSFSEMLTCELRMTQLADNALHQFFDHTGAVGGAVLYDVGGQLEVAVSSGIENPDQVAASDHVRESFEKGTKQVLAIPEEVLVDAVLVHLRPREVVILPISYKSTPLGVVVLAGTTSFTSDHHARLDLFLQGLGLAFNNALVHDRLERLAALDPLTGVYNRRFGLGRLHEEFGRAVRAQAPVGVLMVDIDHFKSVNDTYGHLAGDRVLKAVARLARASLRQGDVLLRYGGEEFLAVLPAASCADLRAVGERVRRTVEDSALSEGGRTIRVTISVGGASYPEQGVETERELIQLADQALYRAKTGGRNRVDVSPGS